MMLFKSVLCMSVFLGSFAATPSFAEENTDRSIATAHSAPNSKSKPFAVSGTAGWPFSIGDFAQTLNPSVSGRAAMWFGETPFKDFQMRFSGFYQPFAIRNQDGVRLHAVGALLGLLTYLPVQTHWIAPFVGLDAGLGVNWLTFSRASSTTNTIDPKFVAQYTAGFELRLFPAFSILVETPFTMFIGKNRVLSFWNPQAGIKVNL